MDSPEPDRIPPSSSTQSPSFQDSPFFNYLSTLSPINSNSSKLRHVGRLFSELNLPPPPPVFTSPRTNPQRETIFLKRPQNLASSNAELSLEYDDRGRMLALVPEVSQPSSSQSTVELIQQTEEPCEDKASAQARPCSPSGCVDEFLADPPEEFVNSIDSPDLHSSQITDPLHMLRSGCSSSKEAIPELVDEDNELCENTKSEVGMTLTSSGQAGEDPGCANSLNRANPTETEADVKELAEKNNGMVCNGRPHLVSKNGNCPTDTGFSRDSASRKQQRLHLGDQTAPNSVSLLSNTDDCEIVEGEEEMVVSSSGLQHQGTQDVQLHSAESGQLDEWSGTPQVLPESFLNVEVDGALHKDSGAMSSGSIDNQIPYGCEEASQHQCGMRRRLQFESADDRRKITGGSTSSRNQSNTFLNARSPSSPSYAEPNMTFRDKQVISSQHALPRLPFHPLKAPPSLINRVDSSSRNNHSSSITTPVPSGIGLHLNSLGRNIAVGSALKTQLSENDCLSGEVEKPLSESSSHLPPDSKDWLVPVSSVGKSCIRLSAKVDSPLASSVENTEVDQQENQTSTTASSITSFRTSPHNMTPLNSLQSTLSERHLILCDNKILASKDASIEELNQISPGKKRKGESYAEDVGCKRCNCKKSKCLKLYCDCFAAGLYCAEPCTCQECFNKPEYEDMVLGTRQQIESRNPLAFAPKIVRHVAESPLNNGEDTNLTTPASARHKRGCNCKKSRCLKKYCECYQAGVGCSAGCRCEGCANVFGKKDGFGEIMELEHRKVEEDRLEDLSDQKLDMVDVKSDTLLKEQSHADLSTVTPLYRCSSFGMDIPKSRHPTRKRQTASLESEISPSSSYRKSPRSPRKSQSRRLMTAREENAGLVHYDQLDKHKPVKMDPFSPRWDRLAGRCDISALQQHQQSKAAIASSTPEIGCSLKDSQTQLCHGSSCLSVSISNQHDSPVTPTARFRGSKIVTHPDYDSGLFNISEDETPDILKETYSPIKVVKTSSPNQKRVSPPHNCLRELRRSSSSPGLRSGRKFILQSVPSFPPLTPYSDPKGGEK